MIYTIYQAINKVNQKVYIGFDSNWPYRMKVHKSASKTQDCKFYRAIRKHGWDNFEWKVIYQSNNKDHTKDIMERFFIEQYDSFHNGYNSTLGGDGVFGLILSEEARRNISMKNKISKPHTQEHNDKIAESLKRWHSENKVILTEETKKKISLATKGKSKPMTDEHKKSLKCHQNNKTMVSCPHCDKTGQLTNMKRWHFDKCKSIQSHKLL